MTTEAEKEELKKQAREEYIRRDFLAASNCEHVRLQAYEEYIRIGDLEWEQYQRKIKEIEAMP